MKIPAFLALALLQANGMALAQTTPSSPASAATLATAHPQAGCLAGIARERRDFAGAVEQGLQLGRIDPKSRPTLERILAEITALEASAKADRAISTKDCKAIYQRVVAENSGIQMTMRSNVYRPK